MSLALRATFTKDFRGASCRLPDGSLVEVVGRKTPLFDLPRELEKRGYGKHTLQAHTPAGTPSPKSQGEGPGRPDSQRAGQRLSEEPQVSLISGDLSDLAQA